MTGRLIVAEPGIVSRKAQWAKEEGYDEDRNGKPQWGPKSNKAA
jgi:hypothetical protein